MLLLRYSLGVAILLTWATGTPSPDPLLRGPSLNFINSGRDSSAKSPRHKTDSITIEKVHNTKFQGQNGLESMTQAYRKYKKPLTPELIDAIRLNKKINVKIKSLIHKRGSMWGTVPNYPPQYYDSEYVVPVQIGTPAQTVYLNLDTGSSDLWTFSTDTPREQYTSQRIYLPQLSSTGRFQPGQTWSIMYGDGSGASGILYKDRVAVVSYVFTEDPFSSGIMGMAMSSANAVRPNQQKTFDNIAESLAAPVMTANLQKGRPGRYTFDFVNSLEYEGPIQYAPVYTQSIYWAFPIMSYQIADDDDPMVNRPWVGIADTGTTLLLLPGYIVDEYYSKVDGARFDNTWGAVLFPCQASMPPFWFGIGLYKGLVPGHYINYGQLNGTHCFGGIQSSDGIGISIIGDILLKAQFVVFDLGRKRVGFANKPLVQP